MNPARFGCLTGLFGCVLISLALALALALALGAGGVRLIVLGGATYHVAAAILPN